MNNSKLFLFTCVKDGRKYINNLFKSLLLQTNTDFIHFIYDNGSTDPIDDLVIEYKEKASKLKNPFEVIYEKTSNSVGLNMATKYCINKCDKPYFIWIDCDNWVHKDFFKHLIKTIKKYPNHILYRTSLYKVDEDTRKISSNYRERKLSLTNRNNAAFTFFTRKKKYYYSFFAVNTKKYLEISNNNILNLRDYYNDEQVLTYCYFTREKFAFAKKSIGYYLARNDSEAHLIMPSQAKKDLFAFEIRKRIAAEISTDTESYYLLIKELFDEYNSMQDTYEIDEFNQSFEHFKKLCIISNENNFSKQVAFRNHDYLHWLLVLNIKRRLK